MDLLDGNCGQVSPLVQLVSHASQDHTRQEHVGTPFPTNQMGQGLAPNSFNMNELMRQMEGIESPRYMEPRGMYAGNSVQENQFEVLATRNAQRYENLNFPPVAQNLGMLLPIIISHSFDWSPRRLDTAEFNEVHELEEDSEINDGHFDLPKLKAENIKRQIIYDDVAVEDVYGVSDLGIIFNEPEYFYNFVENYVLKHSSRKYQKYRPNTAKELMQLSIYCTGKDPIKTARLQHRGKEINIYQMPPMGERKGSKDTFHNLAKSLAMNEQHSDAIEVSGYSSDNFKHQHNRYVFLLTDAYLHEHCFYQACQTLFTWLKNEPDYKDIIPPNFNMNDRAGTNINREQLAALTKMFIKAAQRSPVNLDVRVQIAIAKLCQINQEHEKSIDCYQAILLNKTLDDKLSAYIRMCLGNSFGLAERINEAIDIFHDMQFDEELGVKAITNLGLIHLFKQNYERATFYLFSAVYKQILKGFKDSNDASLENSWSRLRLCFEMVGRPDLCKTVDDRNLSYFSEYLENFNEL